MSIKENICFGKSNLPDEVARSKLKFVDCMTILWRWRKGSTLIGEKGAFIRRSKITSIDGTCADCAPEILMLDDSLSAVDAKTEHLIFRKLWNVNAKTKQRWLQRTVYQSDCTCGPYYQSSRWTYCWKRNAWRINGACRCMLKHTTVNSLRRHFEEGGSATDEASF